MQKKIIALIITAVSALSALAQQTTEVDNQHSLIDAVADSKKSMARDMLDRVEKINIVDTLRVDSAFFFNYYQLSADAGELLEPSALPPQLYDINARVVYRTQNGKEMLWAQKADSTLVIMSCKVLDDGSILEPTPLGAETNDGGGDSDYAFVMQDGMTIYYANNGDNSLGGYDIFMTRRSADGEVLQPQNVGMPYNSPYDDYMMVIDESRNLGWWASNREGIPGVVTIYVFEPSQMRVNHDPDTPEIEELALLSKVKPSGDLEKRLTDKVRVSANDKAEFAIEIAGKMYTHMSQFKNAQARQAIQQLLDTIEEQRATEIRLSVLRSRYEKGDRSVADEIRQIEARQLRYPTEINRLSNKVVSLETSLH